ncbi:hypothetical protein O6H91_05G132400 [Diphasiastrum complanatum]|uniref:Uncharacterized protein n=1 Tax=Diphasiastrum complanatum TaxID=34168 RepID=A0ACC2DTS3_DIPCM|nr:hypothetical protein O6H91_05G132400 [Diphasiastrum complanatum]
MAAATTGASSGSWNALVAGATGATGRYLLAYLLANESVAAITVIGRREVTFPPDKQPSPSHLHKLRYKHLHDLTQLAALDPSQLTPSSFQIAFCCLGTTRGNAGSAQGFRTIDYDCVKYFGSLAKQCGVEHMQLLSSFGANKNSMFLYPKTKGETEEFYRSLAFKQLTIIRLPLLDRGADARFVEKVVKHVFPSIKVQDVAYAMMRHAENVMKSKDEGEVIIDGSGLKKLAQN